MGFELLKVRQRAEREQWPENLGLRVHRALSWLSRAEQLAAQDDLDGQFLVLWIAFNAAYATDIDEKYRESEQQTSRSLLEKLNQLDMAPKRFEQLVWVNAIGSGTGTECLGASRERRHTDVPAGQQRSTDSAASLEFHARS